MSSCWLGLPHWRVKKSEPLSLRFQFHHLVYVLAETLLGWRRDLPLQMRNFSHMEEPGSAIVLQVLCFSQGRPTEGRVWAQDKTCFFTRSKTPVENRALRGSTNLHIFGISPRASYISPSVNLLQLFFNLLQPHSWHACLYRLGTAQFQEL